jgi:hypothetical protein
LIIVDDCCLVEAIAAKEVLTDEYLYRFEENIQADGTLIILFNVLFLMVG